MENRFPPKNLRESLYSTIAFFDVFDRPLRRREFEQYTLGKGINGNAIDDFLERDGNISERDGHFFIRGRHETVHSRRLREAVSDDFWDKLHKVLPKLQLVPFIKAVAVCNTLAFENCTPESDIDLFVITKKGRIFIARVFITVLFHLLGVRRHGEKVAGRICLSFFVSEDGMDLEGMRLENDVYLHFWMKSLRFVYLADDRIHKRFYEKNSWFLDHNDVTFLKKTTRKKWYRFMRPLWELVFQGFFGNWFEKKLKQWHLARFEKNKQILGPESDVVVSDSMLKFHNIDRRKEFNDLFSQNYRFLF